MEGTPVENIVLRQLRRLLCADRLARAAPLLACRSATSEGTKEKHRETQKIHDEFMEGLKGLLRTGEDVGNRDATIIKEKYPDSWKKRTGAWGSRERSRLEGC